MAVEATIRRAYALRLIIIALVCGVLGAWGVYDYAVAIPRKQVLHERLELLRQCRTALETAQSAGSLSPEALAAGEAVTAEVSRVIQAEFALLQEGRAPITTAQQAQELVRELGPSLQSSPDADWLGLLQVILQGLASERTPGHLQDYPAAQKAFDEAQREIDRIGAVTAPSKYDRATQWAFILCLPCVPYMLWTYIATRRRRYRLDDDGTLHMPQATWKADDVAAIDMGRWMEKSVAWVVHRDGTRVKLDDYKFRNLHLIVGSIASRMLPEQWDAQAKHVSGEGAKAAGGSGGDEGGEKGRGEGGDNAD